MDRRDLLSSLAATAAVSQTSATQAQTPHKRAFAKDAVVLITGSNRGVGLGFVEMFLARGAKRVYATGRNPKNLEAVVALDPKRVVPIELDVTNDAQRRAAAAKATDVTWLINNAAYTGDLRKPEERRFLSASNLDDSKRAMDTNCWAPAELARLFIPIINKNGGGAVVNILSVGAMYCLPEFSNYSLSKAACAIMSAGLRAETDKDPVVIASIYTGGVKTRAAPGGYGVHPNEHANLVIDAIERGEAVIYAPDGARKMRDQIAADPIAYERRLIDRFYTNPVTVAPYD